jgi:AcrR family transcriptional regulator
MSETGDRRHGVGGDGASRSTRELVLTTSTELFAERGFAATTMRDLADRADLPLSAFYYYYRRKYDVLLAIMDTAMARLEATAEEAWDRGLDPDAQLVALVRSHVHVHLDRPDAARVADRELRALAKGDRATIVARRDLYERRFREVVGEGVERGHFDPALDIALAAMAILTMSTNVVDWWRPGGRLGIDETAIRLGGFALALVGGRPSPADAVDGASELTRRRS